MLFVPPALSEKPIDRDIVPDFTCEMTRDC